MSKPEVLAVICHRWRPENIPQVITALRAQSVPCHIALVDCSGGLEYSLPPDVLRSVDSLFTVWPDVGPCARFVPPLAMPWFDWTFFAVDDYLPGPKCVGWMKWYAVDTFDKFATIGQEGRRVDADGQIVKSRIAMKSKPVAVDVVTSSELCWTKLVHHASQFHGRMADRFTGEHSPSFEDDLVLQLGIQMGVRCPCVLTGLPPTSAESWRAVKLPAPHALSARPDHAERRDRFVSQAMQLGWRSLV